MKILAIDTSLGASVALWDDAARHPLRACAGEDSSNLHAEKVTQLVRQVVNEAGYASPAAANLDLVAVGRGPAPFTGLRAGLITARVLAHSLGVKCVGVSALDCLAWQALRADGVELATSIPLGATQREHVWVASDARRKEIYAGLYRHCSKTGVKLVGEMKVGTASELTAQMLTSETVHALAKPVKAAGTGLELYPEAFAGMEHISGVERVRAQDLAELAAYRHEHAPATLSSLEPLYLRKPDIHGGER